MLESRPTYDRMPTVFSPEGRLLQVEYASKTVNRANISLGLVTADGVVLAAEEYLNQFQDKEFSRKLFIVDDNIGVAAAGYIPDGRVLVDYAREYCQTHRLIYDEPVNIETVARRTSDIMQIFTQTATTRPFGVSMIFGGINADAKPQMFTTNPDGTFLKHIAKAVGNQSETALNFLLDKYDQDVSQEKAKILLAAAIQRSASTPEEAKIRFLEVNKETMSAELVNLEASLKYLEKAKKIYGE